jgi:protocatechuate 3,4-dioxygenase beta subunit
MNADETPRGRVLSRRELLTALGGIAGALAWPAMLARAQALPACIVRPQQTEGPYFVDTGLERADIRGDPASGVVEPGIPLEVAFAVSRLDGSGCRPLTDAHVELWQCNARGVYSGVRDHHADARGRAFLRGFQRTDRTGLARFTTIYPGWYPGRTVHLHFTIRARSAGQRSEVFTSQLYFDDAVSDRVFSQAPYAERGPRPVRNAADGIYRRGGGQLMLAVQPQGKGLATRFEIALQG